MKVATTGTSFITDLLIEAFISTGNEVICVNSRSEEKALELANKYNIKKVSTNFEEMLEDEEIDTVYIGLPNKLHYEYSKKAILSGKHVVCEKPFTVTYEEAVELFDLAEKNNVYIFEAILTKHLRTLNKVKAELKKIEPIKLCSFNFTKYSRKYDDFKNGLMPNSFNPQMGGGALMDLNIYNIHLAHTLFEKPKNAYYFPNIVNNIDTSGIAILDYDSFKIACISGKDSHSDNGITIMGEKGYIEIKDAPSLISEYTLYVGKDVYYSEKDETNAYHYEIMDMKNIIDNNDNDLYEEYKRHTLDVMQTLEKLKKA